MPNAFVTGGTGFLGTHLIEVLVAARWQITALRRSTSDISHFRDMPAIHWVEGDVTDLASLQRHMPNQLDAVFHVAGSAGVLPHHQEYKRYEINHIGTKNVLTACQGKSVKRLINTSTIATFDWHHEVPMTENTPPNDWSRDPYVHSKRLADIEVEKAVAQGLDAVFLHPCALVGRYDKDTWSKAFREIERGLPVALSPPGGINVCHAPLVARAFLAAYNHGVSNGHYILGGPAVTFLELFQAIAKVMNKPGPKWTATALLFKAFGWSEFLISSLMRREPALTPHTINLLCDKVYGISLRAEQELGYDGGELDVMLQDCFDWMLATGRLPPR